jgi:hypothetical protein
MSIRKILPLSFLHRIKSNPSLIIRIDQRKTTQNLKIMTAQLLQDQLISKNIKAIIEIQATPSQQQTITLGLGQGSVDFKRVPLFRKSGLILIDLKTQELNNN